MMKVITVNLINYLGKEQGSHERSKFEITFPTVSQELYCGYEAHVNSKRARCHLYISQLTVYIVQRMKGGHSSADHNRTTGNNGINTPMLMAVKSK